MGFSKKEIIIAGGIVLLLAIVAIVVVMMRHSKKTAHHPRTPTTAILKVGAKGDTYGSLVLEDGNNVQIAVGSVKPTQVRLKDVTISGTQYSAIMSADGTEFIGVGGGVGVTYTATLQPETLLLSASGELSKSSTPMRFSVSTAATNNLANAIYFDYPSNYPSDPVVIVTADYVNI